MGCTSSQKEEVLQARKETVNGVLKLTITSAKIKHHTSTFFSMDPYIKIRMSNQSAQTQILLKGGCDPVFN